MRWNGLIYVLCSIWMTCVGFGVEGRRLELLFLGSGGHHKPVERFPQLMRALGPYGMNFTYTEDLDTLRADRLLAYDAVVFYGNVDRISEKQEASLMHYVNGGGGFVPLHCASACFGHSQAYVDLVGAAFKSHGTGTFTVPVCDHDHAAIKGFEPFETWDETYVHHRHNETGRTILQYRNENGREEPWTWVRKQGKGRVFYTAYGHDARTWGHAGFQDLVRRGILWAVGDDTAAKLTALNPQALKYEDRPTVQNYEKRSPKPQYQFPLAPTESKKYTQWPVDFEYELFASDPDIVNPIYIAWDERGRCWIAETVDYPNTVNDDRTGRDRIQILEDTDGDGRADKFTVFADGINVPTAFAFHNDGVIVAAAPHFYFLKDTDGDDKADMKEIISSGWGVRDTHAGPSNLQYGFDNWFYGAVGYSGFKGEVNGKKLSMRSGIYRFKPDFSQVEFLSQFNNNTWGMGMSENFDLFGSTANNNHAVYVGIPKRYYDMAHGIDAPQGKKIESQSKAFPITEKFRQVDVFGGFTAAAGFQLYTARDFPKDYWNRVAFVTESTMHLTASCVITKDGAGFKEHNGWNLTASADEWYSPVHAQVGPDGAVWILDWYNFIIQHNPTPSVARGGFKGVNGKGNAHENPLRDKQHGRIWRVVHKKGKHTPHQALSKKNPAALVKALGSGNMFWRTTAQRLLVERANKDIVPDLIALVRNQSVDAIGLNGGALHALYALAGLDALEGTALEAAKVALRHPSPGVRKAAVAVLPRSADSADAIVHSGILVDQDLNVRKDALLAAAEFAPHLVLGEALAKSAVDPMTSKDEWLRDAVAIAGSRQGEAFLRGFARHAPIGGMERDEAKSEPNLFRNADFEARDGTLPKGWQVRTYTGKATHRVVQSGRGGGWCVEIASINGADSSLYQDVNVVRGANYRLSCWVRCFDVKGGGKGAMVNAHGAAVKTNALKGTSKGWTRVATTFRADTDRLSLNLLFGAWGTTTGRALYDDIELIQVSGGRSAESAVERAAILALANTDHKKIADIAATLSPKPQARLYALLAKQGQARPVKALSKSELIAAGRKVFGQVCFSCHGMNGGGTVGPNLTDNHFIHGAARADLDRVIRKGVIEKGMLPWEQTLREDQLKAVSEFVWSMRNTNVKGGKPAEGVKAH